MSVRLSRYDDAAVIARLSTQLGYPSSPEDIEIRLRDVLDRPDGAVLVAEEEGEVVGWIHVLGHHSIETAPFALIVGLVVDETRRSRGTGASLVEAAMEWAARQGHRTIRVRSNVVRERAHAFYERLGFSRAKSQVVFVKRLDR
jgi:GNAT superfamily N-acetyltransferase